MILERALATCTVAWFDRATLLQKATGRIKTFWDGLLDSARKIQAFALLMLCITLICIIGARIKLVNDLILEAEQTAAGEQLRLDQEKQEAIRAAMIAAEQAKAQEAAAEHKADCEAVARVLYGTAVHHSEDAQRAVIWCILNRVDSSLYPNTIRGVCEQPMQWMGYSPDNPVIAGLYETADEVITAWRAGEYRPMSPDFLFLSWTQDEITLRTSFTETKNTHYWRAS